MFQIRHAEIRIRLAQESALSQEVFRNLGASGNGELLTFHIAIGLVRIRSVPVVVHALRPDDHRILGLRIGDPVGVDRRVRAQYLAEVELLAAFGLCIPAVKGIAETGGIRRLIVRCRRILGNKGRRGIACGISRGAAAVVSVKVQPLAGAKLGGQNDLRLRRCDGNLLTDRVDRLLRSLFDPSDKAVGGSGNGIILRNVCRNGICRRHKADRVEKDVVLVDVVELKRVEHHRVVGDRIAFLNGCELVLDILADFVEGHRRGCVGIILLSRPAHELLAFRFGNAGIIDDLFEFTVRNVTGLDENNDILFAVVQDKSDLQSGLAAGFSLGHDRID